MTAILHRSRAKYGGTGAAGSLCQRHEKTAGKHEKGVKIRVEMSKGNRGRKMSRSYSQCFHSLYPQPVCHHTRMRVLSLKSTWIQHAHREGRLCEDTHTPGWKQPCQGVEADYRITDQTVGEPSRPLQHFKKQQAKLEADSAEPSVTLLLPANKSHRVITASGQQGSPDPVGTPAGTAVDSALISAAHYKGTQALLHTPPCWHSQSFSSTAFLHSLTPTLWETADRRREKKLHDKLLQKH